MTNKPDNKQKEDVKIGRRKLIGKYGKYTSPIVLSLLIPQKAYSANGSTAYSSTVTCQDNHMGSAMTLPNHCMRRHPGG